MKQTHSFNSQSIPFSKPDSDKLAIIANNTRTIQETNTIKHGKGAKQANATFEPSQQIKLKNNISETATFQLDIQTNANLEIMNIRKATNQPSQEIKLKVMNTKTAITHPSKQIQKLKKTFVCKTMRRFISALSGLTYIINKNTQTNENQMLIKNKITNIPKE